jgi:hypothetical protein
MNLAWGEDKEHRQVNRNWEQDDAKEQLFAFIVSI